MNNSRWNSYGILIVLGFANIGLLVMNSWCRNQVCVMQQSVKESLQYRDHVEALMKTMPKAQLQKFICTPHPRPDQIKDLLNHKFTIHHLQGDQQSRGAGHLCVTVNAELDSDIYAWLQDIQYYGFQTNYIALFFDDVHNSIVGKIYLKCPNHRAGYHAPTNQASH